MKTRQVCAFYSSLCTALVLLLLGTARIAQAQSTTVNLPFSISGPGFSATGSLTGYYTVLSGFTDTVFVVTNASGTYSDTTDGISGTITGVYPGKNFTSIPSTGTGNLDSIDATGVPYPPASYDNLYYPYGDAPVVCDPIYYPYHGGQLDIFGLLFQLRLPNGGNGLANVWSNGYLHLPSNPIGLDYGLSYGTLGTVNNSPFYTCTNYVGNSNNYPYSTVPSNGTAPGTTLYAGSGVSFYVGPAVIGLTLNPSVVVGGVQTSKATVKLAGNAPIGGAVVKLTSSTPGAASVPATITVPAGASSATFVVHTSQVSTVHRVKITATTGATSKSTTLTVAF